MSETEPRSPKEARLVAGGARREIRSPSSDDRSGEGDHRRDDRDHRQDRPGTGAHARESKNRA